MAELFHWFGNDLQVASNGDLLLSEGTVKGQQYIIRRLLTATQAYIFDLGYGAGLSDFIGSPTTLSAVEGVIRNQLYLEAAVTQNPPPSVTVAAISGGINVVIQYVDAQTGAPAILNFDVSN